MHQNITRVITLLVLTLSIFPLLSRAGIRDVFTIKGGKTEGGCDDIEYDLEAMYDDAVEKINFAFKAFEQYNSDFTIRKIALSFFGIEMNEQMDGAKDDANKKQLADILGGFQYLGYHFGGL